MLTHDRTEKRETKRERMAFAKVRLAERAYSTQLRQVAKHVADLIAAFNPLNAAQMAQLKQLLERYSDVLRPWARASGARMLAEVGRRDEQAWKRYASLMGLEMQREIEQAPVGHVMHELLDQQVQLITSLPIEAGRRVQRLATKSRYTGARSSEIVSDLMRTGDVTRVRATLIARTETARAATALTQARSEGIGVTHYVWRAVLDAETRPALGSKDFAEMNTLAKGSHRKLNGTVHAWSDPPIAAPTGERAHPGSIWNCRCWAEPVLDNLMQ